MGHFLYPISTMQEGVVRQHEIVNICRRGLKGGKVRAPTPIDAYVEAEGRIGIHVDPPVTVFQTQLDSELQSWVGMMDTAARIATALALTREIATRKSAVAIELPPLRMNFLFRCREERASPPKPIRNTKHECRLIYTNVHPYMLFMQSTRTYYMDRGDRYPNISPGFSANYGFRKKL